jgi:GntR family transcriptional regulator/MocR family aminotransferase
LHELVSLPSDVSESALTRAAATRGVGVVRLSEHRFASEGRPGILLGYGNLSAPAVEHGVRLLGEAFAEVRGTAG